jgi:hypothetical protein
MKGWAGEIGEVVVGAEPERRIEERRFAGLREGETEGDSEGILGLNNAGVEGGDGGGGNGGRGDECVSKVRKKANSMGNRGTKLRLWKGRQEGEFRWLRLRLNYFKLKIGANLWILVDQSDHRFWPVAGNPAAILARRMLHSRSALDGRSIPPKQEESCGPEFENYTPET